jgi:4-aminobutyrate aminotransferase
MTPTIPGLSALLPAIHRPLPGPKASAVMERDHAVLSPSYTRGYPLVVARGEGAIIIDVDGNRFLDMNAGIAVVATGHCHPRVVEAIQRQAAKLIHMSGTDFYYENMVALAEKLAALAPGDSPRRVYFGNSGTEAVEAALKLARYHTGRHRFLGFLGGFHGRTAGSLSITASKVTQQRRFGPLLAGVDHIPYANCYRCAYGKQPESCAVECVKVLEERLFTSVIPPEEIAAIVVEPIQGEGGYLVPPPKFFEELQTVARRHGILLIADEVQCGMGRTGTMFASTQLGLDADILTLAKGIASGMPLGAMIARANIMDWKPGAHASTFGGNPVCVEASLATLELLEESLLENARRMGQHLLTRMRGWPRRFPIVGDVRGMGLMIGVEIVRNQLTRETAKDLRDHIEALAFERGVLLLGCGESSIRLSPPLVIQKDQADYALNVMEECLALAQDH